MGCCGGGHNNHQNMTNNKADNMKKDMNASESVKSQNHMLIFALVFITGAAIYFFR